MEEKRKKALMSLSSILLYVFLGFVTGLLIQRLQESTLGQVASVAVAAKLPDPICTGQLYVSPDLQETPVSDMDFVARGGKLAYMHAYIEDPFALMTTEEATELRPTDDTDSYLTMCINGVAFVKLMPLTGLPAHTNINLVQGLTGLPNLQPLDVLSVTLTGGENMYRCVAIGYGVLSP